MLTFLIVNKRLGEYFLDQLSTELSGAYSVTDKVILLGDYNLNYLNKTEKSKLDLFASNSGLEIVNLRDATIGTDNTFTLIDHCFVSKDQIIAYSVTTTHFKSDQFLVIFESNVSLKSESDNIITMRNFRLFSRSKFNRDLALAEWCRMYQCENGNDMLYSFPDIFEKIVEKHAPIQSVKKGETYKKSKPWLTYKLKHLIAQKHFLFNKWKKIPESETYKKFKRLRNLVNRRLKEAHNNFCIHFFQKLPTSKEQWKFIKQKTSPNERIVKVDEIRLESGEISREPKNIVNCLNRSFANLGVFRGLYIACKYPDKPNISEFTFRNVTRKELHSVIDSLDDSKAAGPDEISIRLIKSCKLAIGVHLQFALNECIKEKIFPWLIGDLVKET